MTALQSFRGFAARASALTFALSLSLSTAPLLAAHAARPVEKSFGPEIKSIEVENLVGRIEVKRAPEGRVAASIEAEDSAGKSAADWTRAVDVEFEQKGDRLVVKAVYPLDNYRRYHYPALRDDEEIQPAWLASLIDLGSTSSDYQGRRVRVVGRASSDTPTVWSDFTIEVPAGTSVQVKNLVGLVRARDVVGDQRYETSSGTVDSANGRGLLEVDAGSGDVIVADHEGNLDVETGSGDVRLTDVRGETIDADTGSGDVRLERCAGALVASTGSGDIDGKSLVLAKKLRAKTGSGDVTLKGDFGAVRDMVVDTGSGDVTLVFSAVPSVQLTVSTGSGDIDVDVSAMRVRRSKDEFVADLGAAEGTASIDTGSGDVEVSEGR